MSERDAEGLAAALPAQVEGAEERQAKHKHREREREEREGERGREKRSGARKSRLTCSPTSGNSLSLYYLLRLESPVSQGRIVEEAKYVTGDRQVSDRARGEDLC